MEEIKKGYKMTDVGVIPEDWEVKNVQDTCMIKARIGWQGLTKSEYLLSGPYLLITGTDFNGGSIDWKSCVYVSKERFEQDKYIQIKKQDILITKDGTVGKVAYLGEIPREGTLNSGVFVVRSKDKKINQVFLSRIFMSFYFEDFLNRLVAGSTINHLYQKDFVKFFFPLPKKEQEQAAIATVLSDVDSLISALSKKIEKKKAIKQGLMQQLLTGKKRLSGFCGDLIKTEIGSFPKDWQIHELGSLCKLVTKQTGFDYSSTIKPSLVKNRIDNSIPFIQNKDFEGININLETDFYIPISVALKFPQILLDEPSLLVSISGRIGNVGCYKLKNMAFIGGAVGIAKFYDPRIIQWVMMYLQSTNGQKEIFLNEKAGAQHNITVEAIRKFRIPMPSLEEQTAIASNLSDCDKEISSLQSKLDKYKELKQGMMQQLLTGKIRLIS